MFLHWNKINWSTLFLDFWIEDNYKYCRFWFLLQSFLRKRYTPYLLSNYSLNFYMFPSKREVEQELESQSKVETG